MGRSNRKLAGSARAARPPADPGQAVPRPGLAGWPPLPYALCAALLLVTLFAYWGLGSSGFATSYDDDIYVVNNGRVQAGITAENVRWAFTTTYFGYYYPVTWLSHMLDCQFFGLWAGGHHLTSLLFHLLNTALLFWVLARMTKAPWRSLTVAALFALHPLHVESVAWISERKDVLSTFFWLLALLAYARYAEKPSVTRYLPVFLAFLIGLMAKPMLVTLPFTLLLLDYWPLQRWPSRAPAKDSRPERVGPGQPASAARLIAEKIPLFALVPIFSVLTFVAQKEASAVASVQHLPPLDRVANALVSYGWYLEKTFVPVGLGPLYPLSRTGTSYGLAALSGLVLLAVTAAILRYGRGHRALAVGWLWYLGTLVPVIGLVQVGAQARADRYTYVPLIGVFIMVAWAVAPLATDRTALRKALAPACVILAVALVALTRFQVKVWADSEALFERALAVTTDNPIAHNNLGLVLLGRGDKAGAAGHFQEALRLDPNYHDAHNNIANIQAEEGRLNLALDHYTRAVDGKPQDAKLLNNLGLALVKAGRGAEGRKCFERAIGLKPDFADARNNLGNSLAGAGEMDAAIGQYREALRLEPRSVQTLDNLGLALGMTGRMAEAVECFEKALQIDPASADAHNNLGVAKLREGRASQAAEHFRLALKSNPDLDQARANLEEAEDALRAGR